METIEVYVAITRPEIQATQASDIFWGLGEHRDEAMADAMNYWCGDSSDLVVVSVQWTGEIPDNPQSKEGYALTALARKEASK